MHQSLEILGILIEEPNPNPEKSKGNLRARERDRLSRPPRFFGHVQNLRRKALLSIRYCNQTTWTANAEPPADIIRKAALV
jgi:hypothetical protein